MTNCSIEATRELCEDLESVIELAKQSRAPVRAISLIERARSDLEAYLDEINAAASAVAWSGLG
jgi:ABC-type uncharacterized transport system ATPase subunit